MAVAANDDCGFSERHEVMPNWIVIFAMRRIDDAKTEEDVTLETLFKVWNIAPSFADEARAFARIPRVGRRAAVAKPVMQRLWREELSEDALEIVSSGVHATALIAACEPTAELRDCMHIRCCRERT